MQVFIYFSYDIRKRKRRRSFGRRIYTSERPGTLWPPSLLLLAALSPPSLLLLVQKAMVVETLEKSEQLVKAPWQMVLIMMLVHPRGL